jgi:hypothetical protein
MSKKPLSQGRNLSLLENLISKTSGKDNDWEEEELLQMELKEKAQRDLNYQCIWKYWQSKLTINLKFEPTIGTFFEETPVATSTIVDYSLRESRPNPSSNMDNYTVQGCNLSLKAIVKDVSKIREVGVGFLS